MAGGFSERTLNFLIELRMRNDRDWYIEHKPDYERHVLRPFQALVAALAPAMLEIDPQMEVTPAVGKTISRVYRDSRFTADKSLYRDHAWITFLRKIKDMPDVPAFYFELSPTGYRYGVGFYGASLKTMEEYRAAIARGESHFMDIISKIAAGGIFELEGELYKRSRYTGEFPEIAAWYNRKNIYLASNHADVSETFDSDALAGRLKTGFASLADIYRFWCEASFK
jgi:uncharacterized protein (TIGR02453 family)